MYGIEAGGLWGVASGIGFRAGQLPLRRWEPA